MRNQVHLSLQQKKRKMMQILLLKFLLYLVGLFIAVFLGYFFVRYFAIKTVVIDQSMYQTLESEDVVFVNRISYKFNDPERMDVIAVKIGSAPSSPSYVRRIIGLPGETVSIKDGAIYINDELLEISYNEERIKQGGSASDGITLGEDEYFVMCDNYNESRDDSRLESIGTISMGQITGKVWLRWMPISKFGFIH